MYVDTVTPKSVPFKNFAYTIDIFNQMKSAGIAVGTRIEELEDGDIL